MSESDAQQSSRDRPIPQSAFDQKSPEPFRSASGMERGFEDMEAQMGIVDTSGKGKKRVTVDPKPSAVDEAAAASMESLSASKPRDRHTFIHQGNFSGGMDKNKGDVLKTSLGKDFGAHLGGRRPAGGEPEDYESDDGHASSVSSNPSNWEGNLPQKQMDMLWRFSCDPLRVTDCSGKQWTRLHSTYKAIVPKPGGGLEMIKQKIPYTTDEELKRQVEESGVAKPKRERQLPPLPVAPPPDTPKLRKRLAEKTVPPLPKPKEIDLLELARNGFKSQTVQESDAGSSIFSTTTVSSKASRRSSSSKASSIPSRPRSDVGSNVSVRSKGDKTPSVVSSAAGSKASKSSSRHSTSSSKLSQASSTATRMSQLEAQLSRERAQVKRTTEDVQRAQQELEALEKMLLVARGNPGSAGTPKP